KSQSRNRLHRWFPWGRHKLLGCAVGTYRDRSLSAFMMVLSPSSGPTAPYSAQTKKSPFRYLINESFLFLFLLPFSFRFTMALILFVAWASHGIVKARELLSFPQAVGVASICAQGPLLGASLWSPALSDCHLCGLAALGIAVRGPAIFVMTVAS